MLCRDSSNADWVYIVVTGHCRVIKDLRCQEAKIQRLKTRERMVEWLKEDRNTAAVRYLAFLHRQSSDFRRSTVLSPRFDRNSSSLKYQVIISESCTLTYSSLPFYMYSLHLSDFPEIQSLYSNSTEEDLHPAKSVGSSGCLRKFIICLSLPSFSTLHFLFSPSSSYMHSFSLSFYFSSPLRSAEISAACMSTQCNTRPAN